MKATDLQIGDYFEYQGHIYIVEEISAKGWVHLIHPKTEARLNLVSDYIIDLLEPIPLTPEILEKNGFEISLDSGEGELDINDIYVYIERKKDKYLFSVQEHFEDEYKWTFLDLTINYVHELQHVLRLCGLNELADNLKLEE